jgi:hypothetical protein
MGQGGSWWEHGSSCMASHRRCRVAVSGISLILGAAASVSYSRKRGTTAAGMLCTPLYLSTPDKFVLLAPHLHLQAFLHPKSHGVCPV